MVVPLVWRIKSKRFGRPLNDDNPATSAWVRRVFSDVEQYFTNCLTVPDIFATAVQKNGNIPCLGTREVVEFVSLKDDSGKTIHKLHLGDYKFKTFPEVDREVEEVCKGLLEIGAKPKEPVSLFAETREEWLITAQACWRTSIIVATVYATLGEEGVVYALNQTEVSIVVTSYSLLDKLTKIIHKLPRIKTIVYMKSQDPNAQPPAEVPGVRILTYEELRSIGRSKNVQSITLPTKDDAAVIMYTSGSTGVPKGVVILHSNIVAVVKGFGDVFAEMGKALYSISDINGILHALREGDVFIGYLPLAHVMEMATENLMISLGVKIGYSSPFTLTDNSSAILPGTQGDATVLQPTIMTAVPLVMDRVRKIIYEKVQKKGNLVRNIFDFALRYKQFWAEWGFDTPVLNRTLFAKARMALGGRVKVIISGAAPLSEDTQTFIRDCISTRVVGGYGLTETTSGATLMDFKDTKTDCVGPPILGAKIRLESWEEGGYTVNDKPFPRGEIIVGGTTVALQYYKNEEETKKSFFEENGERWFRTGDIGEILPDGTFRIIDRKKDLTKLQTGEYVAPAKIESILKTSPLVDNACVHADSMKTFVVALISPNEENLKRLGSSIGYEGKSHAELCSSAEVTHKALSELQEVCRKARLTRVEIPQKIALCSMAWTPETELVTAALKVRRRQLFAHYADDLRAMYSSRPEKPPSVSRNVSNTVSSMADMSK